MRCLLILLAACWTSTAPKPIEQEREPDDEPADVEDVVVEPTCSVATFDVSNAACIDLCVRTAPQGWPGCTKAADKLVAQGYTCTRPTPFACQPGPSIPSAPCGPNGCQRVVARVIKLEVTGGEVIITIAAGATQGVQRSWRAGLADRKDELVPNGEVTLLRVDQRMTIGSVRLTPDQIQANGRVLLAP